MPTYKELALKHRLAEKSVVQYVAVPDLITDAEAMEFFWLQGRYDKLTKAGITEQWLRRGGMSRGQWSNVAVSVAGLGKHPTRLIPRVETDEAYAARVNEMERTISRHMRGVLDEVRNAQKVILDRAGVTVELDIEAILAEARPGVEDSIRAHLTRMRRSTERHDDYTDAEKAPLLAQRAVWEKLQGTGLREGWLITKANVVEPHPLDRHPNRTVMVLESETIVAARVAGLEAYIVQRVTA